jgi:hypothetical protein
MSLRLGTRLVAVLLPATLLLPAAAHAEKVVSKDAVGDVVSTVTDLTMLDTGEEMVPAPDNERSDIVRTSVDHEAGLLRVAVTFRDVRGTFGDTLIGRIRTPTKTFTVLAERRGRESYTLLLGRRDLAPCGGLLTTVDRPADKVTIAIPTACVGDPRWVQVGLGAIGMVVEHDAEVGDRFRGFVDDAYATGSTGLATSNGPAFGPKVRRG